MLPILLKEDIESRQEVMAVFIGVLATKDDIAKILAKLVEHSRILAEPTKALGEHTKRIAKFERTLGAMVARWGKHGRRIF